MKYILVFLAAATMLFSQNTPVVKISFLSEDMATGSYNLYLGIDPTATDGLDRTLGEAELPPLPPSGVFDARFVFPDGLISSLQDYRTGDGDFTGTHVYNVSWQLGSNSPGFSLSWNLPDGVTMHVTDPFGGILINNDYGSGINQIFVAGTSLNKLVLEVKYDQVNSLFSHEAPDNIKLEQNYPNPFNSTTNINYFVNEESLIRLAIYDTLGSEVALLYEGEQTPGDYNFKFDAAQYGLAAGVYYYVMKAFNSRGNEVFKDSKKIIYLK